ncbi:MULTISPECIES: hypothetical protein [Myxococcaceae]|uniref:hypothetical protein n=1 Tax=Myxococcaceae TaxID=31 RepID=UPI001E4B7029|nr:MULTISPECIES: hypothetical protein [Myxococcaceae]
MNAPLAALLLLAAAAPPAPSAQAPAHGAAASPAKGSAKGAAGGLTWSPPAAWTLEPERPMRAATYRLAPAQGDAEPAELAVFHFGAGQGGDVEANVKRWLSQFKRPDGSPVDADAKRTQEKVHGLRMTTVDVQGTYASGMMMGPATPKPGWRLLGAIVEGGPEGPVFFKLTGPARTVAAAQKDFRRLLQGVQRGG